MTEDGQIDCCTGQNAVESCWIGQQRSFTRSGWPSLENMHAQHISCSLCHVGENNILQKYTSTYLHPHMNTIIYGGHITPCEGVIVSKSLQVFLGRLCRVHPPYHARNSIGRDVGTIPLWHWAGGQSNDAVSLVSRTSGRRYQPADPIASAVWTRLKMLL